MKALLKFARELGNKAGCELLSWQGRASVDIKNDGSMVTDADRSVDRFLYQQIRAQYPDHEVLSEEGNTRFQGRRFTWVIDPLDGTTNFALGIRYWGCSIAVVENGTPVVGVLVMPDLGVEFWATHDGGAYVDENRLGGPARAISSRNSFLAICSRTCRYLDLDMPQKKRLLGSAAYDLAAVSQGIAVGCTQVTSHIWDIAAGWLLLREAGRSVGPLFRNAPQPFPMTPGDDYGNRVFPLAAAVDPTMLASIQKNVAVRRAAHDRLDAWAAAGWRK